MDFKALSPGKLQLGVLPDINKVSLASGAKAIPAISTASANSFDSGKNNQDIDKKSKILHLFGVTSALCEVTAGTLFIANAFKKGKNSKLEKKIKPIKKLVKFLEKKIGHKGIKKSLKSWQRKDTLKKLSDAVLATASLVAIPTEIGAAIKSKQPGMLLSSLIWALSSPSIFTDFNTRNRGLYELGYAPSFASFANEIHNEFCIKDGQQPRKQEVNWKNPLSIIKFGIEDQIVAAKTALNSVTKLFVQGKEHITGKREEKPEIFSIKPSKESMSLASTLLILGALPKILLGKRLTGKALSIADTIVGSGMIFDTLGMMSLANAKDDSRKTALLIGGPMRIIGDFRHKDDFFYGLRTIGGASCMYYWAGINKEKRENDSA